MKAFPDPLIVYATGRTERGRHIWRVHAKHRQIWGDHVSVLEPGFEFDGASVPRLLWPIAQPAGKPLAAAGHHDKSYREQPADMTRAQADRMFLDGMKALEVAWLRRWLMWAGVRAGGWLYWRRCAKCVAEPEPEAA